MDSGVREECRVACTFDIELQEIMMGVDDPLICVDDLPKLAACSADGKNHSFCCQRKGVPSVCHDFCSGIISDIDTEHLVCLTAFDDIIDCMEEGQDNLPSPPQHVRGRVSGGAIHVFWHEPEKDAERVQFYDVHYMKAALDTTGLHETIVTVVSTFIIF